MAGANLPRDLAPQFEGSSCRRWALLLFSRTELRSPGPGHTFGMADCRRSAVFKLNTGRGSLTRTYEEHICVDSSKLRYWDSYPEIVADLPEPVLLSPVFRERNREISTAWS
jgi:hypothetical protein